MDDVSFFQNALGFEERVNEYYEKYSNNRIGLMKLKVFIYIFLFILIFINIA
jgi:hypothetical protein